MRGWFLMCLLAACSGDDGVVAPTGETVDHGAVCGGQEALVLGGGAGTAFEAWGADQALPLTQQGDSWGLEIRGQASGVHTAIQGSLVLRATWADGSTDDYIAGAVLSCVDDSAAVSGFAALPDAWQADPASHDGETAVLTLTLTDSTGLLVTASHTVTLVGP